MLKNVVHVGVKLLDKYERTGDQDVIVTPIPDAEFKDELITGRLQSYLKAFLIFLLFIFFAYFYLSKICMGL